MSGLRQGERKPQWKIEVDKISALTKGDRITRAVKSDLWFKRADVEYFFSIKTVKPNLDQTEIAKKDMLILKAHDPNYQPFFALYYNPGGPQRKDYNWTMPFKIFDMHNDECVLIGEDYWDLLGGVGTYGALLEIFNQVGIETRKKLTELGR